MLIRLLRWRAHKWLVSDVRARALDMLGRQQIAGIPTAISELFKNAHDAYAHRVEVDFLRRSSVLVLRDDGIGMSRRDFLDRWLTLGTESKLGANFGMAPPPLDPSQAVRPIMGEKGIGRLAIAAIGATSTSTHTCKGARAVRRVGGRVHSLGHLRASRRGLERHPNPDADVSRGIIAHRYRCCLYGSRGPRERGRRSQGFATFAGKCNSRRPNSLCYQSHGVIQPPSGGAIARRRRARYPLHSGSD